ncbi:hypothetical protein [Polyangium spumosum]|uniref:Uncharacterized protein n=1 Tax=Polyangium spumosum TaxID=889282 RepID=A0A6N7Q165_9BACT|nr:hypothetical protein [Polyangium spumosum]MRG98222.1 hypothetical protein [Polyangium spumosum]
MVLEKNLPFEEIRQYLVDAGCYIERGTLEAHIERLQGAPVEREEDLGSIYARELRKLARDIDWYRSERAKVWNKVPDFERDTLRTWRWLSMLQQEATKILVKAAAIAASPDGEKFAQLMNDLEAKLELDTPDEKDKDSSSDPTA